MSKSRNGFSANFICFRNIPVATCECSGGSECFPLNSIPRPGSGRHQRHSSQDVQVTATQSSSFAAHWLLAEVGLGDLLGVEITSLYCYRVPRCFIRSVDNCSNVSLTEHMTYVEDMDCHSKMEGSTIARYSECGALIIVLL